MQESLLGDSLPSDDKYGESVWGLRGKHEVFQRCLSNKKGTSFDFRRTQFKANSP